MIKLKRSAEIHKELGFATATALHKYLQHEGVIEKVRNRWQLTRAYIGCDIARLKYDRKIGWRLYWTGNGIQFLKDMMCGQVRMEVKRLAV